MATRGTDQTVPRPTPRSRSTTLRPWQEVIPLVIRAISNHYYNPNSIVYQATNYEFTAYDYELPPVLPLVGEGPPYPSYGWDRMDIPAYIASGRVTDIREYVFFMYAYAAYTDERESDQMPDSQINLYIENYNDMREYYTDTKEEPSKSE